jgi:hypothetical protein
VVVRLRSALPGKPSPAPSLASARTLRVATVVLDLGPAGTSG